MKTIEQAAKDYARNIWKKGRYYALPKKYSELDFKAGVEFSQQWISVDDELPEIGQRVLLRAKTGYVKTRTIKSDDFDSGKVLHVYHGKNKVTHWRPIEWK